MTVLSVTPATPVSSTPRSTLKVELQLTNTTDESFSTVQVDGVRGDPLGTQAMLDDAIAHPQPPDPNLAAPIRPTKPVSTALGPRARATVTFETTTSTDSSAQSDPGICICANAIYPLYFTARTTDVAGATVTVGSTQTFTPAFSTPAQVQPVQVSWIWPILERPHRLVDQEGIGQKPVFLDDDLAAEVSNGRLSRLVDVLSSVAGQVAMTVVIDPELIDELAVMAGGGYSVENGKKLVPGVGTAAAKAWLEQLRNALGAPGVEVSYTPFADPDVQSLVDQGLSWTQTLNAAAQIRVQTALGNPSKVGNVWWPVGGALDQAALSAIVQHGASSVVLTDRALPSAQEPQGNGLVSLQTSAGPVNAVVTSNSIERFVPGAMSTTGTGLAQLPELVCEVAVRAIENPSAGSYVVITPPRDVDPDPTNAEAAILGTAHPFWSKDVTVADATSGTIAPSVRGPLVPPQASDDLRGDVIDAARQLSVAVPALSSMFSPQDASRLLGSLPAGVQRAESSAWRSDPAGGAVFAGRLTSEINTLESGVQIGLAPNGRYTLASSNSPLPLTIVNNLDANVTVRVEVATKNGVPGFTAQPLAAIVIPAKNNRHVKVPTHVERTGRFAVTVSLYTPTGHAAVGAPVDISVRSTGLGLIGVVITVAAGAVLLLALIVRVIRRWRRRGRPAPPAGSTEHVEPQPVPA